MAEVSFFVWGDTLHRRNILKVGATLLTTSFLPQKLSGNTLMNNTHNKMANDVAKDEAFWNVVAGYYDKAQGIVNLEHGYWGKMSLPVVNAFEQHTRHVNQQSAYYVRKQFAQDFAEATKQVADSLAVQPNEVALTRNASESFVNIITQYNDFQPGDTVMWADTDYPGFQDVMGWLVTERKLNKVKITIPTRANEQELLALYRDYLEKHPKTKLLLLTHVCNQHGLMFPVKEITAMARAKGIDVVCDCAQSWGLIDFKIEDLGVDWAVFNLHKWIGSPIGVGALYMKSGTWHKVDPFPGQPEGNDSVANRVDLATSDFASFLTVPDALAFRASIGEKNIEERLRYLRSLWVTEAEKLPAIEVLGASNEASSSGMGAFRIKGKTSQEEVSKLQSIMETEFGIFTVARHGMDTGSCVRVTPHMCTKIEEIHQLIGALKVLNERFE